MSNIIPNEIIENKIYLIRGQKVMLDFDLANLYSVPTKRVNEQVKRNIKRFPSDFMFQLTKDETGKISRSQFATLKKGQNIKYLPFAFTEQGVAMLSSVLNSDRAIEVNITIMRAFVKIRQFAAHHRELARKLGLLEEKVMKQVKKHDIEIQTIFNVLRKLMTPPEKPAKRIGFLVDRN